MGWLIVRHSFILLFNNLANALRVTVGPVAIGVLIVMLVKVLAGDPFELVGNPAAMAPRGSVQLVLPVKVVTYLFVLSWVAVGWHRFILLEEYPGLLPRLNGLPILPYLGRTVLLAVVMLMAVLTATFILGGFFQLFGLDASPPALMMTTFVLGTLFTFLWLRIALVLPATAVGRPLGMREAWEKSARLSADIFGAAMVVVGLNLVASVLGMLFLGSGIAAGVLNLIAAWITLMIGTSLLTTLYGHLIEGRDLP